ncbi:LOB domain-containing protein 29-like [Asparagus officinalis]|uniref:LOB domain-containing protein 29-like n=1 Tax=Asparagus officinalis TaxID=4686 RepID=UPI00098E139A|nr:LOB domain-containing protein 29-like [Asparagus officinalis]
MTGFGSPCGACKFLRRKCVRGCVFAPYFCHEQGAAHFAAIHKVFGASNVSKILMHLPVADRCEAAVTISYEAQARLQDPVYGCVSHIFALQQQVVNLQAQLTSLKAQAAMQDFGSSASSPQEESFHNNFPPYQQDGHGFVQTQNSNAISNPSINGHENMVYSENVLFGSNFIGSSQNSLSDEHFSFSTDDSSSCKMRPVMYDDMEDLQSVAFAYLQHS